MVSKKKILVEIIYKADYCLSCVYMDKAVQDILEQYPDEIDYQRVEFMQGDGKDRFLELSIMLFGEKAVKKHCRVAPIPSLFIDGELVFDAIPPRFELEDAIEEAIQNNIRQVHL